MIAIVDYGAGNLFSLQNACMTLGFEARPTSDPEALSRADGILLPGCGAFGGAMRLLRSSGMADAILEAAGKKPLLGICLGMQMLFQRGFEFSGGTGLGLMEGSVVPIDAGGLRIPHMGWNTLEVSAPCPLLRDLPQDSYVYFTHSFRAEAGDEYIAASAWYGERIPAVVQKGIVFGAQFHPEKSGDVGLKILSNFGGLCR